MSPALRTPLRRILAMSRAEVTLFIRNRTILLTALLTAPVMVLALGPVMGNALEGPAFTLFLVQMLSAWSLLFVVYYNVTCILVARREDGVFQRLSTGEATRWEALIATSLPSILVFLIQMLLGGGVAMLLFGAPTFANPVLPLVGVIGGAVIMTALSAWTSSLTTTVEGAQYSTMPLLMVFLVLSGTSLPLSVMPDAVQTAASATPLYAVGDLIGLGLEGTALRHTAASADLGASWTAAARPVVVLAAWALVGIWAARARMRFVPRR